MKFLLLFTSVLLLAQEETPGQIALQYKYDIQKLQIDAYKALVLVTEAQKEQKEAQVKEIKAKEQLDEVNSKIDSLQLKIEKEYNAEGWMLTPEFQWKRKEKK